MIYLIRAGDEPHYKLGYTTRAGWARRREMQGSNFRKLRVVAVWPGSYEQEQRMHELLTPWRGEGGKEWYQITPEDLRAPIIASGHPLPEMTGEEDPIAQLLPTFTLSTRFERLPPQPKSDDVVDARIKSNIQEYYLQYGPHASDHGHVRVGAGARDLLTSGIVDCDLWVPHDPETFGLVWSFDLQERHGSQSCLDALIEEGVVERLPQGLRIVPECEDASLAWEMAMEGLEY